MVLSCFLSLIYRLAINAWALERVTQEAMEAEQFRVFSQVVTQVWQAIDRQRARRR